MIARSRARRSNNSTQRTALCAAADAERQASVELDAI